MFNFITNTKINPCLLCGVMAQSGRLECETQLCPVSSYMILSKSLNWPKPQFPNLENKRKTTSLTE